MIEFAHIDRAAIERAALEYAVNALWQLPLLAGAAWLAIRLLTPPPRTQHRLWVAVLLLAVVMPAHGVNWRDSAVPTPSPVSLQIQAQTGMPVPPGDALSLLAEETPAPAEAISPSPTTLPAVHARAFQTPKLRLPIGVRSLEWFVRLYVAVVLLGALRIVRASWAARSLVRRSHPIALPEPLATLWSGYGQHVRLPQLRESDEVAGPVIIGIRVPVLLVPSGFLRYPEAEVKAALCHELAHVVRHDYAANLLCQVLTLPVVWHPVTHAIERRIGRTREMLCDAMAASRMESSVAYARALLALAQGILQRRDGFQVHGLGLLGNNMLEERVERLMNGMETKMQREIEITVRAKVARITGAASAMAASMVIAATFHVAPLLAQESPAAAPTEAQTPAVQAAPAPAPVPAPQASAPARPEPAPTPAPAPMQGTANPPTESESPAPAEIAPAPFAPPALPALPNLGDIQLASSLPGVASLGKGSVVIEDGAATHVHRWTSADGRHYVVLNDQAANPSEDERQRIEQKSIDARKLAGETGVKIDKDFRLKVQKQVKDATAYMYSPEFKKKMAEARIDEATALARLNALNSPELKAQLARLNSPEFRKELEAAAASQAKALADLNSSQAEMKQSMEDATKRMEEATKRLEAATRALEAAQAQMQKK